MLYRLSSSGVRVLAAAGLRRETSHHPGEILSGSTTSSSPRPTRLHNRLLCPDRPLRQIRARERRPHRPLSRRTRDRHPTRSPTRFSSRSNIRARAMPPRPRRTLRLRATPQPHKKLRAADRRSREKIRPGRRHHRPHTSAGNQLASRRSSSCLKQPYSLATGQSSPNSVQRTPHTTPA
jgi:hypothetical protein